MDLIYAQVNVLSSNNSESDYLNDVWVIPCNPNDYDVVGAFEELQTLEWKQSTNIKPGDTVYIYVSGQLGSLMYKTRTISTDHYGIGEIDDRKFHKNFKEEEMRYMVLHLEEKYAESQYPYADLKEHGLNTVQGPSRMTKNLKAYLES